MASPPSPLRAALNAVLAPILVFGILALLFNQTLGRRCTSSLVAESPSPTGLTKALITVRGCRAAGTYTTQVSLVTGNAHSPTDSGNVLTVEAGDGRRSAWPPGGPEVSVEWAAETLLIVHYDSTDRVLRTATRVDRVSIMKAGLQR